MAHQKQREPASVELVNGRSHQSSKRIADYRLTLLYSAVGYRFEEPSKVVSDYRITLSRQKVSELLMRLPEPDVVSEKKDRSFYR
jgi:hypothetical protein